MENIPYIILSKIVIYVFYFELYSLYFYYFPYFCSSDKFENDASHLVVCVTLKEDC